MPEDAPEISSLASELGWLLARTREERGLKIDTIASVIHMRKHYVQAMEEGRFDELPGTTYVRGYLKRYAEFLELNALTILEMYDRLDKPEARKFFTFSGSIERSPYPTGRLVSICIILAFALLLFWTSMHSERPIALVEPYAPFENVAHREALPHRCEARKAVYPPCFWEDLGLWYLTYLPEKHLFVVDKP